jgi:hypothetical protein
MANVAYRGAVRGGTVVLRDAEPPLAEGTEVPVTPVAGAPGSPAAVLAAVEASPRVPAEWVDELERLIAQGRRPPTRPDPFRDEPGGLESQ